MSKKDKVSEREKTDRVTHTLCNTYFTPVELQHVLLIITSMNHCLLSGCPGDEREHRQEGKGMTESGEDKVMCVALEREAEEVLKVGVGK